MNWCVSADADGLSVSIGRGKVVSCGLFRPLKIWFAFCCMFTFLRLSSQGWLVYHVLLSCLLREGSESTVWRFLPPHVLFHICLDLVEVRSWRWKTVISMTPSYMWWTPLGFPKNLCECFPYLSFENNCYIPSLWIMQ